MTKVRLWPIGALALLAGLALAANSLAATTGEDAPADRYFGQQKMSPLSVRQRVDALGRAYAHRWIADGDLLHDATIAGTSLNAWRAAFPRDTWLAPTTFHLAELFADVQTSYARSKAVAVMQEVAKFYGATRYGHLARVRLAAGFPPLHAESAVMPTPGSYASAAPAASGSADASAAPAPAPASPAPSPSGSPAASPAPASPLPAPVVSAKPGA